MLLIVVWPPLDTKTDYLPWFDESDIETAFILKSAATILPKEKLRKSVFKKGGGPIICVATESFSMLLDCVCCLFTKGK